VTPLQQSDVHDVRWLVDELTMLGPNAKAERLAPLHEQLARWADLHQLPVLLGELLALRALARSQEVELAALRGGE